MQYFGDYTRVRVAASCLLPCSVALQQHVWLPTVLTKRKSYARMVNSYLIGLREFITYCKVGTPEGVDTAMQHGAHQVLQCSVCCGVALQLMTRPPFCNSRNHQRLEPCITMLQPPARVCGDVRWGSTQYSCQVVSVADCCVMVVGIHQGGVCVCVRAAWLARPCLLPDW